MPRMAPCALRMRRRSQTRPRARGEHARDHVRMAVQDLVAECITMSAPSEIGRVKIGVGTCVDRKTASAPWAISAAAAMSLTAQVGLLGVSTQMSLVPPGLMARSAPRSSAATKSASIRDCAGNRYPAGAQRPVHGAAARRHGRPAPGWEERGRRRHAGAEDIVSAAPSSAPITASASRTVALSGPP